MGRFSLSLKVGKMTEYLFLGAIGSDCYRMKSMPCLRGIEVRYLRGILIEAENSTKSPEGRGPTRQDRGKAV